jgi:hypothetical protein
MAALLAIGLQRTAALTSPWTIAAEDIAAVETARARGAAVVEAWRDADTVDRSLDNAGIVGPRAGWLRWSAARGEKWTALIRLEDLIRIGEWAPSSRLSWGAADWPEICLCLSMPRPGWEARGQPRDPESAAVTIVEPSLRVAIELHRRKVPAALAPGVLMLVVTDLAEKASLPHQTDFAAIGTAVGGISPQQFDDYIAAVAARGPLVRAGENSGAQR